MGVAFTDYDSDGDVDLVLQATTDYNNYILNLFEIHSHLLQTLNVGLMPVPHPLIVQTAHVL